MLRAPRLPVCHAASIKLRDAWGYFRVWLLVLASSCGWHPSAIWRAGTRSPEGKVRTVRQLRCTPYDVGYTEHGQLSGRRRVRLIVAIPTADGIRSSSLR